MCMEDTLARIRARVEDRPISIKSEFFGDLTYQGENPAEHHRITLRGGDCVLLMLARNDQNMSRSDRVDVLDCESDLILRDLFHGDLTRCESTEEAGH